MQQMLCFLNNLSLCILMHRFLESRNKRLFFVFFFRELLGCLTAFSPLHVVVNMNHTGTFSITATVNKISVLSLNF